MALTNKSEEILIGLWLILSHIRMGLYIIECESCPKENLPLDR